MGISIKKSSYNEIISEKTKYANIEIYNDKVILYSDKTMITVGATGIISEEPYKNDDAGLYLDNLFLYACLLLENPDTTLENYLVFPPSGSYILEVIIIPADAFVFMIRINRENIVVRKDRNNVIKNIILGLNPGTYIEVSFGQENINITAVGNDFSRRFIIPREMMDEEKFKRFNRRIFHLYSRLKRDSTGKGKLTL